MDRTSEHGKEEENIRMAKSVDKVQRVSVADQVYDILVKKITDGEWRIGEKIPSEIELSHQLGVSRVTLKIALQKLNTLGVTETRVGEGTFVCDFNLKNYFSELMRSNILNVSKNQINEFRILLEYCTMRLVVLNPAQPKKLSQLEKAFQKMTRAIEKEDDKSYHDAHFQFHRLICSMSNNLLFIQLYDAMTETFYQIYKSNSEKTWSTMGREESITHHRHLLDALKGRNLSRISQLQDELLLDEHIRT